jgi:hypothetical protein
MLDVFRKQEQRLMGGAATTVASPEDVEDDVNLEPPPPPDIDMTAYLLAVSTAALFNAFSDSTLSKTEELADTVTTTTTEKPKVKWVATLDQKTCQELPDSSPGCGSRNGTIYDYDDAELQTHMPGRVHPYCRCFLETIVPGV